jgi:hypothetical protein
VDLRRSCCNSQQQAKATRPLPPATTATQRTATTGHRDTHRGLARPRVLRRGPWSQAGWWPKLAAGAGAYPYHRPGRKASQPSSSRLGS